MIIALSAAAPLNTSAPGPMNSAGSGNPGKKAKTSYRFQNGLNTPTIAKTLKEFAGNKKYPSMGRKDGLSASKPLMLSLASLKTTIAIIR